MRKPCRSALRCDALPGAARVMVLSHAAWREQFGADREVIGRVIPFEGEPVEIIGVILNKVLINKVDYVSEFARRGLKRQGLDLLGVIPHQSILSSPSLNLIRDELKADGILLEDGPAGTTWRRA